MNSKLWAIEPSILEDLFKEKQAIMDNFALIGSLVGQAKAPLCIIENGVAVINIESPLFRRKSVYMTNAVSHKQIKDEISKALANDEVKAILYNIYSPGGTVAGTEELASFIREASSQKPSCAFVDGICCSAAYWLASATGKIFATESAELGSIGVVLMHSDYSKFYESMGLKYTYITAGSKKSVGASEVPLSDDDKDYLQNQVNGIYEVFLQEIAQNMKLDINNKEEWADGRVFLGKEALALGLVTKIVKTKEEAIKLLLQNTKENNFMQNPNNPTPTNPTEQSPQTASTISNDLYAIIEVVCGAENAQKVKSLAEAGMTENQIKAFAPLLAQNQTEQPRQGNETEQDILATNKQILEGILSASPDAVSNSNNPKFNNEEQAIIARIGGMQLN